MVGWIAERRDTEKPPPRPRQLRIALDASRYENEHER